MKCPICRTSAGDADVECPECGESLSFWRMMDLSSRQVRQRGLAQAAKRDFVGACLSFVEAALSNPLDTVSLVDAGRALVHLDRIEDAQRMLEFARQRDRDCGAAEVAEAVRTLVAQSQSEDSADESGDAGEPSEERGAPPAASGRKPHRRQEKAVASRQNGPGAGQQPLLGLRVVERRAGLLSRVIGGGRPDSVWITVLEMEAGWPGDWGVMADWLRASVQNGDGHPVFHYMLGLACWQRDHLADARECFQKCIDEQCRNGTSPVLNPAAYYLCASLETPEAASQAHHWLRDRKHTPQDVEEILERLEGRLADWPKPHWLETLKRLRLMNELHSG